MPRVERMRRDAAGLRRCAGVVLLVFLVGWRTVLTGIRRRNAVER